MEIKIGDRFKNGLAPTVVEVIEIADNSVTTLCVISGNAFIKGDIDRWFPSSLMSLEYIGNFSKQNNFETLYNLMNS